MLHRLFMSKTIGAHWLRARYVSTMPRKVSLTTADRMMSVDWQDGHRSMFPLIWLVDNCSSIIIASNDQRTKRVTEKELKLSARNAFHENDSIVVEWEDGRCSSYKTDWLRQHCLSETSRKSYMESDNFGRLNKLWNAQRIKDSLFVANFYDIMNDDKVLYQFLENLDSVGLCVMTEAPCKTGQLRRFCRRVGFVRETHFG